MRIQAAALVAIVTAVASTAAAQRAADRIPPKRTPLPAVILPVCPPGRLVSAATTDEQRRQARDLISAADQAGILGDTTAALASLRRARSVDSADADVAFRLARLYETAAIPDSAVKEYCRFLAISPASPDAADVRERLTALARPASDPVVDSANSHFEQGLRAYDAGRMLESEAHFSRAIDAEPAWADAYFDRAIVRAVRGERDDAASDYEVYIRLRPTAADRADVTTRVAALRGTRLSSGQAFGLGLVIPGAGQFYTRRPLLGTLYLLGTATAIGLAMQEQTTVRTTQQTATDPFGNPYTYTSTLQAKTRGHLGAGLAAAAAIDLVGAIEAAVYAGREHAAPPPTRVSLQLLPAQTALAMRIVL